jgi:hypothetical protein
MTLINRISVARLVIAVSLLAIASLTLYPDSATVTSPWNCIVCGTRGTADMFLNILLFAPLGVGLALAGVRHGTAFVLAATISGTVELAQVFIPGRDASIGDLISNSAGSGLGFALMASARHWYTPTESTARWLTLGASFATAGIVLLTGVMLQSAFTDFTYYGQWTPKLRHLERYRGSVLQATAGTIPLPSGKLENTAAVVNALEEGSPISVRAVAGPPTSRPSSLFGIADAARNTIVMIGLRRHDLFYTFRMRAESFRLDRPNLVVPGAMDFAVGDTIDVAAWRTDSSYCVEVNDDRTCDLGFTAGSGWTLLQFPESLPAGSQRGLNVLWLCMLLIPFGYWLRPNLHAVLGGAMGVVALSLVPAVTGLLATPLVEWAGAVAGVAIGISVRVVVSRLGAGQWSQPRSRP